MSNHQEETNRAYAVCPGCKGEGTHGPGHVYTQADRDEMGYEWDEMMEDYRNGVYDVRCETCLGKRVVRKPCPCADCRQADRDLEDMYAMERAERAFGC